MRYNALINVKQEFIARCPHNSPRFIEYHLVTNPASLLLLITTIPSAYGTLGLSRNTLACSMLQEYLESLLIRRFGSGLKGTTVKPALSIHLCPVL
jgi:hypothetical protein